MSKKQHLSFMKLDTPYQRMIVLIAGLVVAVGVLFVANTVTRGLGGHEKKIAEALFATLEQPYISGKLDLSQQSQTDLATLKGTFVMENLNKVSADTTAHSKGEGRDLTLPIKLFADLKKNETYMQASGVHQAADAIAAAAPQLQSDLSAIADRVEGKWLRLPQQGNEMNMCTSSLAGALRADPDVAKQLVSAYTKNRFLTVEAVKRGDKDSAEYTVHTDNVAAKKFLDALKKKEFFKSAKNCNDSYDPFGFERSSQQSSESQAQSPQIAGTTKLTVADGKLVRVAYVSSVDGQLNSSQLDLSFAQSGKKPTAPTENIVEYAELTPYMAAIGSVIQQQMSQQGAAQSAPLALPQ